MIEKFFIGFLFLSFSAWSQVVTYDTIVEIKENQTGVYDTIVYIKKHVEVKVEVLVIDTVKAGKWACDIQLGTGILQNKPIIFSPNLTYKSSQFISNHASLSIYYNFSKKLSLRLGAMFNYQKINTNYTKTSKYFETVNFEIKDTLDIYFNVVGNDTSYFYIIETNIGQREEERIKYSAYSPKLNVYYLKFPIQFNYSFLHNKWNFSFLAGTSLNFKIFQNEINQLNYNENVVSFYPTGVLSMQTGYSISRSSVIHIEPYLEHSLTSSSNNIIPNNQFMLKLGVKHFF